MLVGKKAEAGIGTLIVFIAMILVSAIAASVLIQTATSLQSTALITGTRTKDEVSTGLQVISVFAEDGTGGTLTNFSMKVKLSAGSDGFPLEGTLIEVSLKNGSADLTYNSGDHDCTDGAANPTTNYATDALVGTDDDFLDRGELLTFCFQASRAVTPDEKVSIRIVPKVGIPTAVEMILPTVVADQRIYLYP